MDYYRVPRLSLDIPNYFLTRITQPNRRSNRCRTRTFSPRILGAHPDVLFSLCA